MPTIHLALIAYREASVIKRCLESFAPHVDAVAICHARGSAENDDTARIAQETCDRLGVPLAQTEYFNAAHPEWPHVDDFAAARNAAFKLARDMGKPASHITPAWPDPTWLMWADCDDVLSPTGAAFLSRVRRKDVPGEVIYSPYVTDPQGSYARRERLIRPEAFESWVNAVHEIMKPKDGTKATWSEELQIVHVPAVTKRGSVERNLRILEGKPEATRTGREWFCLFREYELAQKIPQMFAAAAVSAQHPDLQEAERWQAFLSMGRWTREVEEAEHLLLQAARMQPDRREPFAELVQLHLSRGSGTKAHAWARMMLGVPSPVQPAMDHNGSLYGWRGQDLMWLAMAKAGMKTQADEERQRALKKAPCRISVAHPTCRPDQAKKIRELWYERATKPETIEYIFGVNEADIDALAGVADYPHVVSPAVAPGLSSAVANYNAAVAATTGPIVICAQDDIFPPHGWDEQVFRAMQPHLGSAKVLHVSDGFRPPEDPLMVVQCVTRPWLRQNGGLLFANEYDGYFSDTEFSIRAYASKQVVDGRHIQFYHNHPAFTEAASDEAYMRQHNEVAFERGKVIFEHRNAELLGR